MGKYPELAGKRFGKLVVVSKAESVHNAYSEWNCVCDCGSSCVVRGASLVHGKRKDCGCETIRFYDLTGIRFGKLVATEKLPVSSDGKTRWKCVCDCGNVFTATSLDLRKGKKSDCGCITDYYRENHPLIDLTNQRFGKLTVLSKDDSKKDRRTRWLCQCDCGNMCTATSYSLRHGKNKSCGCGRRKDIAGIRFGKLTAIERSANFVMQGAHKKYQWKCICDCGETVYMLPEKLRENINHACSKCASEMRVDAMLKSAGFVEGTQLSKIATAKPTASNKSGVKGVFWNNKTQKWRAMLRFQGQNHYLGEYNVFEKAVDARKEAEEKYFAPILEKYSERKK